MDDNIKNNFTELETLKLKKYGNPPSDIQDKIDKNISLLKTVGNTIELFSEKLIKTIIKLNK